MDIKDISKELTREEFMDILNSTINCRFIYDGHMCECPEYLGLADNCSKFDSCKDCWLSSIKDIKFKGEINMNKREELETLLKEKREIQKTINQEVQKIMDKIRELPVTNFENEKDEECFCVDLVGKATPLYAGENTIKNYNTFTSKKYAEKVAYKQWFERKLLAYKDEHGDKCDWNNGNETKYNCYFFSGNIYIDSWNESRYFAIFFNSEKLLQKHIEDNKQEWIKYFNICKELD